jgi:myosin-5
VQTCRDLCHSINFANERLQGFFNEHIIRAEQEEYMREGIFWKPLKVPDNSEIIHLIDNSRNGMYTLLDSTCLMPRGTAKIFTRELFTAHKRHNKLKTARAPSRPAKGEKVLV